MKRIWKVIFLSIFTIIFFIPHFAGADRGIGVRPISPSGSEVVGNQWLFIIGINTYIKWPPLKTAVNDAKAVKDVLLSRYYFNNEHLIELYDEEATRRNIISKLRYLANNIRGEDSLVIFYAGHGQLDSITKSGSWIPVESGTQDASAWISNNDIKDYLKIDAIRAKHILLISDSCFAGDFFRGSRGIMPTINERLIQKAYQMSSRQAITSGGLEPVSDTGFGKNSIFSYFLIKTLKENQKPFLVPSDMFQDIKAGVAENADQFPILGSLKDTGGQQGGEIVFFLRQDSRLRNLSNEALEKSKELERLRQMETEATAVKKKEEAEISKREKEVAELDAKIAKMRKKLGTADENRDDSLDRMLAMARQKDAQEKHLEELKRKRQAEEAKRLAEIEELKAKKRIKMLATLEKDISKYRSIISSIFWKSNKEEAWKSLLAKYPSAGNLKVDDTEGLKFKIAYEGIENSIGMKFVRIPPGTFMLGSPPNEPGHTFNEKEHQVTLTKEFYIQTTEVTQDQWKKVMGNNPSQFKKCGDDCPVEKVSWHDVKDFIHRLNQQEGSGIYRLPTEAEWECAARAGTKTPFAFDRCLSTDQANYDGNYPLAECSKGEFRKKTVPVGSFSPNSWGLYDMHGNVWEWCQDWYKSYPSDPVTDPTGPPKGSSRLHRGGSWFSGAGPCRSANRNFSSPEARNFDLGFRLVLNP
ncbi:MAG: SUMF1/EgtB/PvdO family nonheme iron enzyme [Proteobacteria bacterium]|nr:SUMF1/EgtB/PvdO family nonheme iron enzyme [Pseudomonadota bacterium]